MGSVLVIRPDSLAIADRLAFEGNVVRVLSQDFEMDGNPKRVGSLKLLDQYDFALAGSKSYPGEVEKACSGCSVLGSGGLADRLEADTSYLKGMVKALCVAEYLEDSNLIDSTGISLIVSAWFDGKEFIYIGYFVEYLRMADGGRGPVTDGMGYVLWKANPADALLETFLGIGRLLGDLGFTGPVDIEYVLTEDKALVKGMSVQVDQKHLLWHELLPNGLQNMFWSLVSDQEPVKVLEDYAIGVICQSQEEPQYDISPGADKHFYSGIATARGETVHEARRRVKRTLKNTTASDLNIFYRTDIGTGVEQIVGTLKMWGWLNA